LQDRFLKIAESLHAPPRIPLRSSGRRAHPHQRDLFSHDFGFGARSHNVRRGVCHSSEIRHSRVRGSTRVIAS
jgi:hypothetical protein